MAEQRTRVGQTVAKTLFAISGNLCYFGGCDERMADPTWKKCNGEIAHICGERKGAARYDSTLSVRERNSHENLMLLCPRHHKLIDQLRPDDYPVAELRRMKAEHEARAEHDWATDDELTVYVSVLIAPMYEAAVRPDDGDIGRASGGADETTRAQVNVESPGAGAFSGARAQDSAPAVDEATIGGQHQARAGVAKMGLDAPSPTVPPQVIRAPRRAATDAAQRSRQRGPRPPGSIGDAPGHQP